MLNNHSPQDASVTQAIILAAGRGVRFRPVTDTLPKPLVEVGGKPLIEWQLEMLMAHGVNHVVINCCYLKELLIAHVRGLKLPLNISFSEEEVALETGGGIKQALPLLQDAPFFAVNSDVILWQSPGPLAQLERAFALKPSLRLALLLHPRPGAIGLAGAGDFFCDEYGAIWRKGQHKESPYFFTGVQLLHPSVFEGMEQSIFSMNVVYDRMLKEERDAIAGIVNKAGIMLHVGDPEGHRVSETFLQKQAELQ